MNSRRRALRLLSIVTVSCAALVAPSTAAPPAQSPAGTRAIVQSDDRAGLKAVEKAGGRLLADYGAFGLWEVSPAGGPGAAGASPGLSVVPNTIPLRGGRTIDTSAGRAAVNSPSAAAAGPRLWLVQFIGPIRDEWLAALEAAGLRPVQYTAHNAYVVWGDAPALARLDDWSTSSGAVQWHGEYRVEYKVAPALAPAVAAASTDPLDVTVQFDAAAAAETGHVAELQALASAVLRPPSTVAGLASVTVRLPAGRVTEVAGWADVYNVEPYGAPGRMDEVQSQIVAGNLITAGPVRPSGPGYLAWLASKRFPTDPNSYPIVDVVDDGIDQGNADAVLHPDFHELGQAGRPDRIVALQNCTHDAAADGGDGHGNINAGILGSYNNLAGFPHVDALGYRIGLGVSPYGRIAGTKIYRNGPFGSPGPYDIGLCGGTNQGVVERSYANGAAITSNSWGYTTTLGGYDANARDYDAYTRDASTTAGLQPMLHIFSAGNEGAGADTVTSPGTAKNVLTVGATENVRDNGVLDGCDDSNADNADDLYPYSSRGPTDDGRVKPDLMSPGVHVQGPASQSPNYDGAMVCGARFPPGDDYYPDGYDPIENPDGQSLYTWSSGTSHSTPAVAGAAQLASEYYERVLRPGGPAPSPAMLRALLINGARYLTGSGANDTLPSNNQGWGDATLAAITDGTPRVLVDQSDPGATFEESGGQYDLDTEVAATGQPLRVTLAWSDAPGPTTGGVALVNDLDLQVTVGGVVYRGNVFSGRTSAAGGTADNRNTVESVFLPAGASGPVHVRVTAANIAGDGVPTAGGDATDQDFALVVYNAGGAPDLLATSVSRAVIGGNQNVMIEPGETVSVSVRLQNAGSGAASGIAGHVSLLSANAAPGRSVSAYPDIAIGGTAVNTMPYTFTVSSTATCGSAVQLRHLVDYNSTRQYTHTFSLLIGSASMTDTVNYPYAGEPVAAPDLGQVVSTLAVAHDGQIGDIDVRVNLTHEWDADLTLTLVSPLGTAVLLTSGNGGSGDNYTDTVFDDEAGTAITAGTAPFTGRFRPESLLSALDGEPLSGQWQLRVEDAVAGETGRLLGWSLDLTPMAGTCVEAKGFLPAVFRRWAY